MRWPFRRVMTLAITALTCTSVGWWYLHRPIARKDAHARVDRLAQNWGRIPPGEIVSTRFEVHNDGGIPLSLGEPSVSCGCTKPALSSRVLEPGATATLDVRFSVPTSPGAVKHTVRIATNDPEQPMLEWALFAEAWRGVRATPQALDAGRLMPGANVTCGVQLSSPGGQPFRIKFLSSDLPEVRVIYEVTGRSLPVHRLRVTYTAGASFGPARGSVRVTTDRADAPWLDIPVAGETIGPVSVSPSFLEVGSEDIGREVRRMLIVRRGVDEKLALSSIKVAEPWEMIGKATRTLSDGSLILDVTLRFPRGAGSPTGEMEPKLGSVKPTVIRVPLRVRGWLPPLPTGSR